jgi:3-hydroxyisobutyrate dehydrogenase-like beta-hydroxyacid dehydrogenase
MFAMSTIAILGLGEAGRIYARGLRRAGAHVRGFDLSPTVPDLEIDRARTAAEASEGADVVLSLVGAQAAAEVAASALPVLTPTAVYADLNTASPQIKRTIGALAAARGVPMADVAVLAPVPREGYRTQLLASGPGADALAARLRPLDVPIVPIGAAVGDAARLKLLRSVFMKGLAALVIEGTTAAREFGADDWLRDQIAQELGPDGRALVDRLIEGTHQHAPRRHEEMLDSLAVLDEAGQPADMTRATLAWLERIIAEGPDAAAS